MDMIPLFPLFPPDVVARGSVRQLTRGPSLTATEVLQRARLAMNAEDAAEEYARDPIGYARSHQRRGRIIDRFLRRN